MKLEDQVCTFRQAKRLKELGINQKSLFYWKENEIQTNICYKSFKETTERILLSCNKYYSAFTAAELVQMNKSCSGFTYSERKDKWYKGWKVDGLVYFTSFAETCADKLISSLENEWVTNYEINQRL